MFLGQTRGSASRTPNEDLRLYSLSYVLDLFQLPTPLYMDLATQQTLLTADVITRPVAHIT